MDNRTQLHLAVVLHVIQDNTADEDASIEELDCAILHQLIMGTTNDEIPKIQNYYEQVVPRQNMSTFKSHFRMSPSTFEIIHNYIAPSPQFLKRNFEQYGGREQICPEKCLLVTLWTLATPDSYRSIGERFNIAKSSVFHCLNTIILILLTEVSYKFLKWPTADEKITIANSLGRHGLRHAIGAIDGCHIPIKRPTEHAIDFFNRKKFYSVVLQGVCRHDLVFIDCDIRWPGSVHDGRVLRTSDLYPVAQDLCGPDYYLVGDSAYPCKNWLMSPFRNNGHMLPQQTYFNRILSRTRVSIENAFALLKGRFRRLKDMLDRNSVDDIVNTIMACCILHNICLLEGNEEDDIEQYIAEGQGQDVPMADVQGENDIPGAVRRNYLMQVMWNENN